MNNQDNSDIIFSSSIVEKMKGQPKKAQKFSNASRQVIYHETYY